MEGESVEAVTTGTRHKALCPLSNPDGEVCVCVMDLFGWL
eukprot:COSAG02_NODE_2454_length_8820_cov_5.686504_5_plen_40_part_00